MITDADINKMKRVFATKEDLKRFVTKDDLKNELKRFATKLDLKESLKKYPTRDEMSLGFRELVKFIGEVKIDIMKELDDFREEFNGFRQEMRDINRNSQSTLNDHESRIAHLEYNKS